MRELAVGTGVALVLLGAYVVAGPLSPPAGPVAGTSPSLSDLESQIAGLGSDPGELVAGRFADTSSTPGDATDGKPSVLPVGQLTLVRLDLAGVGTFTFQIADLSRSYAVITTPGGGGTTGSPGQPSYDLTMIRPLPTDDDTLDQYFESLDTGQALPVSATLSYLGGGGQVVRQWNLFGAFVRDIDVRIVGREAVEQVRLSIDQVQAVGI